MYKALLVLFLVCTLTFGHKARGSSSDLPGDNEGSDLSFLETIGILRPLHIIYDCLTNGCSLWSNDDEEEDPIVDEDLIIHIVPHSHTDAGWIEPIDWYYDNWVKKIFDNILVELYDNPGYTFVWADTNYLNQWFESQTKANQDKFMEIVKRKQIEFVGGGWVQNDESLSDLKSIVNQMNFGLQYLHERFNATPTVGWQIDPFGYNHYMPGVFSELGYKYLVLNRIGDLRKEDFKKEADMAFWLESADVGESDNKILTHVLPRHYEPFEYDRLISTIPEFTEEGPTEEIKKFVDHFYDTYVKEQIKGYKSKHFMMLMGQDFGFRNCKNCLGKLNNLAKILTKYSDKIKECKFSTPSQYFEHVEKHKDLSTKNIDFLNYDERLVYLHPKSNYDLIDYWVGYYFTRPHLKKRINEAFNTFRSIETLLTYTKYIGKFHKEFEEVFEEVEKQLSYMLHHDAITGTSRKGTIDDYYSRIEKAEYMMNQLLSEINKELLGQATEADGVPDDSGITKKPIQYFNQAVYKRELVITIPIKGKYVRVYDEQEKQYLKAELVDTGAKTYSLYVKLTIGGLTMKSLTIETSKEEISGQAMILTPNQFDPKQKSDYSNDYYTLTFSNNTLISKLESKVTKRSLQLNQEFNYFENSQSGLYIFKPEGDKAVIDYIPKKSMIYEGDLVTFIHSVHQGRGMTEQISQSVTIFKTGDTQTAPLIEITATPWKYVELGFSMSTKDFSSHQEFFNNDSNEFVKRSFRKIDDFDESGKNIYPVVHGYAVKDGQDLFGIVNNYPTGCGYIDNSQQNIECFLTRTTNVDDDKGVPDNLDDDIEINFSFFLSLSSIKDYSNDYYALSDYFNLPLTTKVENQAFDVLKENEGITCLDSDEQLKHDFDNKDYFYSSSSFSLLKKDLKNTFEVFDLFENHKDDQFLRIRNREFKNFMEETLDHTRSYNELKLDDSFVFELEKDEKYTLTGIKKHSDLHTHVATAKGSFIKDALNTLYDNYEYVKNGFTVQHVSKEKSIKLRSREIATLKLLKPQHTELPIGSNIVTD